MDRRTFLTWMVLGWLASASPVVIGAVIARAQGQPASNPGSNSAKSLVFYVAPDGNDAWSGKLAAANGAKTDGPFATLKRARDAIRALKRQQGGRLQQPVNVQVRGGTYFLNEPLVLTPEDSGTAEFPITYQPYQGEKPILSGGRPITGWKQVTVDGKPLWAAQIPGVKEGKFFFRQLWINRQRRFRARYPNKGYLRVAQVPDTTPQWFEGQTRFRFRNGDLKAWKTVSGAEVVVMTFWLESHLPVVSVDEKNQIISFSKRSILRIAPGDLYYIENAFELLDTPGEWYLDKKTGTLYYWPQPGENMSKDQLVVPALAQVVRLEGKPEAGQFLEHLLFQGLTFSHTEWFYPEGFRPAPRPLHGPGWPKPDVVGDSAAAISVPGAVYAEGIRNCSFVNCTFSHLGTYGVELARGCQNNRIVGCEIFDLGAGGIKIGEGYVRGKNGEGVIRSNPVEHAHSNQVTNCHIYSGGRIFHAAYGILVALSYNNRIAYNHLHDFYNVGISSGWTWNYVERLARDNIVEFNHVHHLGQLSDGDGPLLNDKGALYTAGTQPGTVIRSNLVHDIQAFNFGGWGIYLDGASSQVLVEKNIVYRTRDGGFHQSWGKDNIVRNNIFAFGSLAQIRRSKQEDHLSFRFERNIVYWKEGQLLDGSWKDSNFMMDRNVYWRVGGGEIVFDGVPLGEWQAKKGMDKNSIIADPLFVAPEKGEFQLKPDSPALKLGFQPISIEPIGLQASPRA